MSVPPPLQLHYDTHVHASPTSCIRRQNDDFPKMSRTNLLHTFSRFKPRLASRVSRHPKEWTVSSRPYVLLKWKYGVGERWIFISGNDVCERTFLFLLETRFRVSRHPKKWIGGVGLRRDGVEPVAKKRAHEDSNARPPKKTVKVLPLGNYSSRQQTNLPWHRRLRVYHQPPTTNHQPPPPTKKRVPL